MVFSFYEIVLQMFLESTYPYREELGPGIVSKARAVLLKWPVLFLLTTPHSTA